MSKPMIYILDDEETLVDLHCEVAELAGFDVLGFTSAHQFFEQVTRFNSNSILVLDLHMPEMDGIEVMRRLAMTSNPPSLILISGHDIGVLHSAEKLCKAHGLEVVESLRKPLPLDTLLRLFEQRIPSVVSEKKNDVQPIENEITISDFQQAISNEELLLYFQPQIEIESEEVSGVEVLVRWLHPERGMIAPDNFIPLIEQTSLMSDLTYFVIDKTVKQVQLWKNVDFNPNVSVNISAMDITGLMLPELIAALLKDNKLDPAKLTLEVTESALMGELVTSLDILTRLRLKGLCLSIDDFGTGYSSLSQLHRVPFTELKIDTSFTCNMSEDDEARAIVKTCIILGHELNMRVVAEGVETEDQFNLLKTMGCDIAQGYFFARPMPANELIAWVKQRKSLNPKENKLSA